jgi:hypothetical protein
MSNWETNGKWFGYPECCINDFVTRGENDFIRPTRNQSKISNHSGFIPCSYCSWKVLSKQCKLEDLIDKRRAPYPFKVKQNNKK